jgi:acyl carrier protein phosphodiesterase
MNYLAHLYLSGHDEHVVVGNFMGDYVKGKDYTKFPPGIQLGILLHRQIDSFTDTHQNCRSAKSFFRNDFGLYSGIVVDFIYDHILAQNWGHYSNSELIKYAGFIHFVLQKHQHFLPARVQGFLPFLIQHRRLESYATETGIGHSMNIMSKYSSFPPKAEIALEIFRKNKEYLILNFKEFMEEMIQYVENQYKIFPRKTTLIV